MCYGRINLRSISQSQRHTIPLLDKGRPQVLLYTTFVLSFKQASLLLVNLKKYVDHSVIIIKSKTAHSVIYPRQYETDLCFLQTVQLAVNAVSLS